MMAFIDQIIAQGIPPIDSRELQPAAYQPSMAQPMNVPMRQEPKMIQDGGVIQKTFQQMSQDKQDESKQNIWLNLFNEIQRRSQTTGADVSQSILRSATPAFSKYASPQEVASERMKQELTPYSELLKIKADSQRSGGSTPAVLQINAAVQQHKQLAEEAAANGDMQTAQRHIDEANQIMQIGKVYDKGVSPYGVPQSGVPLNQQIGQNAIQLAPAAIPGYGQAVGSIEAAKKGMSEEATQSVKDIHEPAREGAKTQAQKNVELGMNPQIKGAEKKAEKGVDTSYAIDESIALLDEFDASAAALYKAAGETPYTGPIMGRIGSIAEEPSRTNLESAQNTFTLQAKTLLKMPNNNFSDADRNFLVDIAGGKFGRQGGIQLVATRLQTIAKQQRRSLESKKASLPQEIQTPTAQKTEQPAEKKTIKWGRDKYGKPVRID